MRNLNIKKVLLIAIPLLLGISGFIQNIHKGFWEALGSSLGSGLGGFIGLYIALKIRDRLSRQKL